MYCGLDRDDEQTAVRNLRAADDADRRPLLDLRALGRLAASSTPTRLAEQYRVLPGRPVDFANKLLKPVTNFWTTYRRLAQQVSDGTARPDAYQPMAKWVADNPQLSRTRVGASGSRSCTGTARSRAARTRLRGRSRRPATDRPEPARRHGRRRSHRAARGDDADLRPRRQRGRDALRPARAVTSG